MVCQAKYLKQGIVRLKRFLVLFYSEIKFGVVSTWQVV